MPKKSKNKKHFADGEVHEQIPEPIVLETNIRNYDELFGTKDSPFDTMDGSEYKRQLEEMNIVDLQKESAKRGLFPNGRKDWMIAKLMTMHKQYVLRYNASKERPVPYKRVSKKAEAILAEGKNKLRGY